MKKHNLIYFIAMLVIPAFVVFYSGCKKKEKNAESCTDGVQNQGETGIDCGGPCAACPPPPVVAPCSPATGTFKMGPTTYSVTFTNCMVQGGQWNVSGNASNADIYIIFPTTTAPTSDGEYTYPQICLSPSTYNDICIQIDTGGDSYYSQPSSTNGGKVYVNIVNGKVVATFCNTTFVGLQSSITYTGCYGKLACN